MRGNCSTEDEPGYRQLLHSPSSPRRVYFSFRSFRQCFYLEHRRYGELDDFLADPVIGDRSDTVRHARTPVRLVMRIRGALACQESPPGHIDPRVVSYPETCRSCHLPPR